MVENTRTIRRRIKSITSTRKITKAMELVSAAKMRRASAAALATRPYALSAWSLIEHLVATTTRTLHPLLAYREVKRTIAVVMTTDRGLVGGLNAQLIRTVLALPKEAELQFITVGKRGQNAIRRSGGSILATFPAPVSQPRVEDIRPISKLTIDAFRTESVDRVMVIYPDFVSALRQVPRVKQLLPLHRESIRAFLEETGRASLPTTRADLSEFTFEPTPDAVLELVLPQLVEVQLYQAQLEAAASEHAARMVAMRSATDAAGDLFDDLTLALNQTRQAAITKDLSEISASRAALQA